MKGAHDLAVNYIIQIKMKKIVTTLFLLILTTALLSSCSLPATGTASGKTGTSYPESSVSMSQVVTNFPELTLEPTLELTPQPSVKASVFEAGAPDLINLYVNRQKVSGEYTTNWIKGKDIAVFYAYPTQKESVENLKFMDLFKLYWYKFPKADDYKIGYFLTFTLESSEIIELPIRLPKDCPKDPKANFYQYIEVYVYDNLHRIPGPTFYHLEPASTFDNTIMTSIKLTAGTRFEEVVSAKLTAFIFKDESDFDPSTGKYKGPVSCTVDVINSAA